MRTHSHHGVAHWVSRYLFPVLFVIWVLVFVISKTLSYSKADNSLRGSTETESIAILKNSKLFEETIRNPVVSSGIPPNHAVIVAGHAVMKLSELSHATKRDDAWYLLPYQVNQGFPDIITSHVKKGVEVASKDPQSLLLFSGGQTRRDVGPTSEAASYYYLAQQSQWLKSPFLQARVVLEEHARDSFENLLFSLCRFHEITGHYPTKVTVIGFDFKSNRFSELHRKAIGFPESNFSYIGLRPQHPNFNHLTAATGERAAINSFRQDMYGCSDNSLKHKREARNPFKRTNPYPTACPDLQKLLEWCGPKLYYEDKMNNNNPLPWQ